MDTETKADPFPFRNQKPPLGTTEVRRRVRDEITVPRSKDTMNGWNNPAQPPTKDGDYNVLLRSPIHRRRVFAAVYDVRPGCGWYVDLCEACVAVGCEIEEHRYNWSRWVVGWLPLPGIEGVPALVTAPAPPAPPTVDPT